MRTMQEVLSNTRDSRAPLAAQEFYELCLEDSDDIWKGRHIVRQAHARWDQTDRRIVWDNIERWRTRALWKKPNSATKSADPAWSNKVSDIPTWTCSEAPSIQPLAA